MDPWTILQQFQRVPCCAYYKYQLTQTSLMPSDAASRHELHKSIVLSSSNTQEGGCKLPAMQTDYCPSLQIYIELVNKHEPVSLPWSCAHKCMGCISWPYVGKLAWQLSPSQPSWTVEHMVKAVCNEKSERLQWAATVNGGASACPVTATFSLLGSPAPHAMLFSVSSLAAIASLRLSWLAASAVRILASSMSSGVVTCAPHGGCAACVLCYL